MMFDGKIPNLSCCLEDSSHPCRLFRLQKISEISLRAIARRADLVSWAWNHAGTRGQRSCWSCFWDWTQQVTVLIQKKQGKRTEIVYQILSSGFRGWPHAINYPQLGFAQFDASKIWNLHISIIWRFLGSWILWKDLQGFCWFHVWFAAPLGSSDRPILSATARPLFDTTTPVWRGAMTQGPPLSLLRDASTRPFWCSFRGPNLKTEWKTHMCLIIIHIYKYIYIYMW